MSGDAQARKPTANAKRSAARLMAVQAVYQNSQNPKPVAALAQEYLTKRTGAEASGEESPQPDGALLKIIIEGVHERLSDLESLLEGHYTKGNAVEPLLKSILLCGFYELLAQHETDSPIIISDYLDVTAGFYSKSEISLVNAVLDTAAKSLREATETNTL